ncbi:MAG: hypothetical protein FWE69_08110 [Clostridiales bacterium]|nr:hypothetical protein [Clostridiales bacterium]
MKRLLALILTAGLALSLLPVLGFAANGMTVAIEPATGAPGDTVDVQIFAALALDNGFGLDSLTGQIIYDRSAVRLLSWEYGKMLTSLKGATYFENDTLDGFFFTFISLYGRTEDGQRPDGLFLTLTFELITDTGTAIVFQRGEGSVYNMDTDEQIPISVADTVGYIDAGQGIVTGVPDTAPEPPIAPPEQKNNNAVLWTGVAVVSLTALGYLFLLIQKKRKNASGEGIGSKEEGIRNKEEVEDMEETEDNEETEE